MNPARQHPEGERRFIETLRPHFEQKGYTFRPYPDGKDLPEFMGRYEPDAIATRAGHNIAIEVKNGRERAQNLNVRSIRHLFEGQPDWQLRVFYIGGDPGDAVVIPTSTPDLFLASLATTRDLLAQGRTQAAFLMSWSLLEAAARMSEDSLKARPQSPGTVVQTLAMSGMIDPDSERRIRTLIELRNRVAHGDLGADPLADDVEDVLSVAEGLLTNRAKP